MTDRTTPQEASRAAFEAWAKPRWRNISRIETLGQSLYWHSELQREWEGWQAATQARDAECAALRDALTDAIGVLDDEGRHFAAQEARAVLEATK